VKERSSFSCDTQRVPQGGHGPKVFRDPVAKARIFLAIIILYLTGLRLRSNETEKAKLF
jgi:hypothetical protein